MRSNTTDHSACIAIDTERLREGGPSKALIVALIVWMLYIASGFRLPTQPITLSDENANAAVRQLIFAGTGMLAFLHLYQLRAIGSTLVSHLPFILFTACLVLSAAWSMDTTLTLKRVAIFVFGILAQLTIVHSSKHPVSLMLHVVVIFCMMVAVVSLLVHIALPLPHSVNPGRPGLAGISNHPNTLSPIVSIGMILSFGLEAQSPKGKIAKKIGQAALAIALVLTFSITTWASTLVCLGLYLFLSSSAYHRGSMQIVALVSISLILLVGWTNIKSGMFDAIGRDESLSGRDELWATVWYQAKQEPLIGHGFGAFWTEGKGRELVQTWNPRQSHNAYLDVFVDLGICGLFAMLALFPLNLFLNWPRIQGIIGSQQRKAVTAMMSSAIGYMITYGFSQSFFLRYDIFAFFIIAWITLLFTNKGANRIEAEFADESGSSTEKRGRFSLPFRQF